QAADRRPRAHAARHTARPRHRGAAASRGSGAAGGEGAREDRRAPRPRRRGGALRERAADGRPPRVTPRSRGPLTRRQLFDVAFRGEETGHWIRMHRQAMACRFEVTLSDEDARFLPAARAALDEVDRIEDALTVFRETSEVAHVNREA